MNADYPWAIQTTIISEYNKPVSKRRTRDPNPRGAVLIPLLRVYNNQGMQQFSGGSHVPF